MKHDIIIAFIARKVVQRLKLTYRQTMRVLEASVPQKKKRRKDEV